MNWKLLTVILCLPLITSSTENTPMNILSQRVAGLSTELVRVNGLYLTDTVDSTTLVADVTRLEGSITRLTSDLGIRRSPRLVAKLRESLTSLGTLKN